MEKENLLLIGNSQLLTAVLAIAKNMLNSDFYFARIFILNGKYAVKKFANNSKDERFAIF